MEGLLLPVLIVAGLAAGGAVAAVVAAIPQWRWSWRLRKRRREIWPATHPTLFGRNRGNWHSTHTRTDDDYQ